MAACASTMTPAGEISPSADARCFNIGLNLPTRSVEDTQQTKDEIQVLYAAFAIVCPDREYMIP